MPAKLAGTQPGSTGENPVPPTVQSAAGQPPETVGDRAFLLGTLALAALAFGLGLMHIGRNDIWFDEAASFFFARRRGLDFFRVLLSEDTHGPLYYGLLKLWTLVFGERDWLARLPSVLCAGCAVFVVARLGARLFGRAVGLCAGLMVALSPFHISYAQEVRFYSFIECMASLHALCFVSLLGQTTRVSADPARRSRWPWWGFVATGTACLLTFYLTGLLLVAEIFCVLLLWKHIERKRVLGAFAAVALVFSAWLPALIWQIRHTHGSIKWILKQPTWKFLSRVCTTFTAGKGATWFDSVVAVVLVAGAIMTLIHIARRRDRGLLPLFCWFLLPLVAVLIISLRRPLYEPRYLMMILPAFFLLAAAGLYRVRLRSVRLPLIAAVIIALVIADVRYYTGYKSDERWRDAVALVRREGLATDIVVAVPSYEIATLTYYLPDFQHLQGTSWASDFNRLFVRGHRLWVLSHRQDWRILSQQIARDVMQLDSRNFASLNVSCFLPVR